MKRFILILFVLCPVLLLAQNMIWTGVGVTDKTDRYKLSANVEERMYIPLKHKDFLIDYRMIFTRSKVMPLLAVSFWDHDGKPEIRPYYGLDSRYVRFMIEHHIYFETPMETRFRCRIQYQQKITNWLSLFTSEELFWTTKFDHNRLLGEVQFHIRKVDLDVGYMSYYKNKNQNVLIIKLNHSM